MLTKLYGVKRYTLQIMPSFLDFVCWCVTFCVRYTVSFRRAGIVRTTAGKDIIRGYKIVEHGCAYTTACANVAKSIKRNFLFQIAYKLCIFCFCCAFFNFQRVHFLFLLNLQCSLILCTLHSAHFHYVLYLASHTLFSFALVVYDLFNSQYKYRVSLWCIVVPFHVCFSPAMSRISKGMKKSGFSFSLVFVVATVDISSILESDT